MARSRPPVFGDRTRSNQREGSLGRPAPLRLRTSENRRGRQSCGVGERTAKRSRGRRRAAPASRVLSGANGSSNRCRPPCLVVTHRHAHGFASAALSKMRTARVGGFAAWRQGTPNLDGWLGWAAVRAGNNEMPWTVSTATSLSSTRRSRRAPLTGLHAVPAVGKASSAPPASEHCATVASTYVGRTDSRRDHWPKPRQRPLARHVREETMDWHTRHTGRSRA
jgi:hypothetical protein